MTAAQGILDKSFAKPALNIPQMLTKARTDYQVGMLRQLGEIMRLQRGKAALTAYEYFYYNLFDPHLSQEDKERYVGDERGRAIFLLANKLTWWDAAEDKLLFQAVIENLGHRVPQLYAVAHPTRRHHGAAALKDSAALRDWLKTAAGPIYGKPVIGSHGAGGILIESVDAAADELVTDSGERHKIERLLADTAEYFTSDGYLFQEVLRPHPAIAAVTSGRLSTLRIIVLIDANGPRPFQAVCRLPSGKNRVDNFRKPGNLIASVDPETGRLGKVTRGASLQREFLDVHPDSGASFADFAYPSIEEAVALALEASLAFPRLHIQSWDIAVAANGVYAIEMNPGGNFNVAQLALGRGVFDDDLRSFVQWCNTLKMNPDDGARKRAVKLIA